MAMASRTFLPEWFATLITVSALLAAATSINTLILTTSRSFFALARNRIYPEVLSRINLRTMEPYAATITVVLLALLGIAAQGEIIQYASLTVIGVMLYGIVWSVALTQLPTRLPEHYANARFRLSIPAIWIIASLKVAISVVFLYIGVVNNPGPAAVYLGLVLLGFVYYLFRRAYLERAGVDLAALLRDETRQQ
jgi:APA family basic amino acid/polyamine antiporter